MATRVRYSYPVEYFEDGGYRIKTSKDVILGHHFRPMSRRDFYVCIFLELSGWGYTFRCWKHLLEMFWGHFRYDLPDMGCLM